MNATPPSLPVVLGCIADDLTGATDICSTLVAEGMRTVQIVGVPREDVAVPDADAVVVALKSRTIPAADAVAQSLSSLRWLQRAGAKHYFFKYCSTFDSRDEGNIGPVADALLDALRVGFTIATPAFPETGRTVYQGHLFVGKVPLSESPMRDHPLTPMRDSNLVRVLGRQTSHPVGLIDFATVSTGAQAIVAATQALREKGIRFAIVDACNDGHLRAIGEACASLPLLTGGSGLARGLPGAYRRAGLLRRPGAAGLLPATSGAAAVLAGSCSAATLRQVAHYRMSHPSLALDPATLAADPQAVDAATNWALQRLSERPLVYTSASPAEVAQAQASLGAEQAASVVEVALSRIAQALVRAGVDKLVVAGGETSGAVVNALNIRALRIGPPIDPGVPWTSTIADRPFALALKSGNFGGDDFFTKALECAP